MLATSKSLAIQALQLNSTVKDDFPALLAVTAFQMNRENGGSENDATIYSALSAISNDPVKLRGHSDAVRSVVIANNGTTLFSCGDDSNVFKWNLTKLSDPPVPARIPKEITDDFRSLTLTRNDEWLIAGTNTGKIVAWKGDAIQQAPRILEAHFSIVNELVSDHHTNKFYSCGSDGRLLAWNYDNGNFIKTLLDSVSGNIRCIALSPSGKQIVYATDSDVIKTLFLEDKPSKPVTILTLQSPVLAVSFNNAGNILAIGCQNGSINTLSPVGTGGKLQTVLGRHVSGVTGLAFNPKDNELASSGFDWSVKISAFPLTEEKPETIESHDLWIYGIRFMPDNKHLVSFSADKTITFVSTQNYDMAQKLKQTLKRNMTGEEWRRMVGDDIPYQKTFENLP